MTGYIMSYTKGGPFYGLFKQMTVESTPEGLEVQGKDNVLDDVHVRSRSA